MSHQACARHDRQFSFELNETFGNAWSASQVGERCMCFVDMDIAVLCRHIESSCLDDSGEPDGCTRPSTSSAESMRRTVQPGLQRRKKDFSAKRSLSLTLLRRAYRDMAYELFDCRNRNVLKFVCHHVRDWL